MLVYEFINTLEITGNFIVSIKGDFDGVEYEWANNYTGLEKLLNSYYNIDTIARIKTTYTNKIIITIYIKQDENEE